MTWRCAIADDSKELVLDNPRLSGEPEAKKLASLLPRQKTMVRDHLPFPDPLVCCRIQK